MNFVFKQAVCLDGKDYSRGVHHLSGKILDDKVFKKYCGIGWILKQSNEDAEKHVLAFETLAEKQNRLAEKISSPKPEVQVDEVKISKSKKQK